MRRKGVGDLENGARTAARFSVFKYGDPGPQPPARDATRGIPGMGAGQDSPGTGNAAAGGRQKDPWTCWGPGGDLL